MNYDVDVFMPYHANLQFVSAAIDSVLWQQGVRVLLHLVNDCSPEDDSFLIEKYKDNPNIRWYKTTRNTGPYFICNCLFQQMESQHFAIFDSDDIALPTRLSNAIESMRKDKAPIHTSACENFLDPSARIKSTLQIPGCHYYIPGENCVIINGTMVIKKETFERLNGFDGTMKCAADTEFSERAKFALVKVSGSKEVTCLRRLHGKNLTNSNGQYGVGSTYRNVIHKDINSRIEVWKKESHPIDPTKWGTLDSTDRSVLMPVAVREKRIVGMATYPARFEALLDAIESLYEQVDELHICLNEYDSVPDVLAKLDKVKCTIPKANMTDGGKYLSINEVSGLFFSCDDDLIYPPDYIETMIAGMERNPGSIVSYHGRTMHTGRASKSYYRDFDQTWPFSYDIPVDHKSHILGTGVTGFHTDLINLDIDDFQPGLMSDIHFSIAAEKQKVPRVVLAHDKGWIKQNPKASVADDSIFESQRYNDRYQTALINSQDWIKV